MEAMRLIEATRCALVQARAAEDVVIEALQVQALAAAVGGSLAVTGPPEMRADVRGLSEAGMRAHEELHRGLAGVGAVRAAQLSEVQEPRRALTALSALLGEAGVALVAVACSTEDERIYWECVEAIDTADESGDRVRALLRKLAARDGPREGVQPAGEDAPQEGSGPDPAAGGARNAQVGGGPVDGG
ncbi:DUF6099 family protein [Streptomyces meridianus]|uniref:DUF6099 family protein n=1 Tax=Streptomyces meridianus TaxID=2938945 RepID=UPI0027E232F8|nr:DUF6099 family protein [Streptomyces meridianus]